MTNTYDILLNPPPKKPVVPEVKKNDAGLLANQQTSKQENKQTSKEVVRPSSKPTRNKTQSINLPVSQSINRPMSRSVNRPVDHQLIGKVVDRPVAFYIPEIIDEKIDEALDYIEKRHRVKVDRSALISAILGNPTLWESAMLNQLVERAVNQLTSRLTSRLTKR